MTTENFAELLEQSLADMDVKPGTLFKAKILKVNDPKGYVIVDSPFKSEGYIKMDEFLDQNNDLEINEGDEVSVVLDSVEDGLGETRLSRIKAKRQETWQVLETAHEDEQIIEGLVVGKVKGGLTVEVNTIRAFLPGSLVDNKPLQEHGDMVGEIIQFKVIKIDKKRNNVVISRKAVMDSVNSAEKEELLNNLEEGQVLKGIVKNLTAYGAFVDLGGIDGLLHITDISWKRVQHPKDLLNIGQEVDVKILKFDKDKGRVSLGLKQLGQDPWLGVQDRYPEGSRLKGIVTNIADYGCFVQLEEGIEGLVHVSEMDWTNRNIHPGKVVSVDTEVEVMLLDVDESRRRISLGLKQCKSSPWQAFAEANKVGTRMQVKIKSITDFGIFVGLEGRIDGLIHMSDISWDKSGPEAIADYKKGQEIEAVLVSVDPERERIALGIKQLIADDFTLFCQNNPKGTVVSAAVEHVNDRDVVFNLANEVSGVLRSNEVSSEQGRNLADHFNVGDKHDLKIVQIDKKERQVLLSIKALETQEAKEAMKSLEMNQDDSGNSLGDLLKSSIKSSDD